MRSEKHGSAGCGRQGEGGGSEIELVGGASSGHFDGDARIGGRGVSHQ